MDLSSFLQKKLQAIKKVGRFREIQAFGYSEPPKKKIQDFEVIDFASNDYLGLSKDPRLLEAGYQASKTYGSGSGASRLISGTTKLHNKLEKQLALFQNAEAALFFDSGYSANIGCISSLMGPGDLILSDELNHSSLLSGAKLSGASIINYKHCSISDLRLQLTTNRAQYRNVLITTDSVFSMDGDIAPLKELYNLAQEFDSWLLVDEAHAVGVFGKKGQGLVSEVIDSERANNIIQMGTCSKALGVQGGFVTGSIELIEFLKQRARTFIYSTAPSPFIVGALLESLKIVQNEDWRRKKVLENSCKIKVAFKQASLQLFSEDSQIICFKAKDNNSLLTLKQRALSEYGLWIGAIRKPTSPSPRVRITTSSLHSDSDIAQLTEAISKLTQN